ncbi:unnamed protein product [Mycena citricolor]|uniref:Uncharacterized protein n=1 Tax=Mycena citricolor TaxID=2018698 RepID=A0AAD2K3I1_9AGAR|nr:unnamed protein product [Mycena citricolor]
MKCHASSISAPVITSFAVCAKRAHQKQTRKRSGMHPDVPAGDIRATSSLTSIAASLTCHAIRPHFPPMPAPETTSKMPTSRPVLGHVNLMADTLIANASLEESVGFLPFTLRAIVRSMVSSGTPGVAGALATAARARLVEQTEEIRGTETLTLFVTTSAKETKTIDAPAPALFDLLRRARALYGCGMGFASLGVLATIVDASLGARWFNDQTAELLAVVDSDIAQAIQSCKEEIEGGRVDDYTAARQIVVRLRDSIETSDAEVARWGGEPPFERAGSSLMFWKV